MPCPGEVRWRLGLSWRAVAACLPPVAPPRTPPPDGSAPRGARDRHRRCGTNSSDLAQHAGHTSVIARAPARLRMPLACRQSSGVWRKNSMCGSSRCPSTMATRLRKRSPCGSPPESTRAGASRVPRLGRRWAWLAMTSRLDRPATPYSMPPRLTHRDRHGPTTRAVAVVSVRMVLPSQRPCAPGCVVALVEHAPTPSGSPGRPSGLVASWDECIAVPRTADGLRRSAKVRRAFEPRRARDALLRWAGDDAGRGRAGWLRLDGPAYLPSSASPVASPDSCLGALDQPRGFVEGGERSHAILLRAAARIGAEVVIRSPGGTRFPTRRGSGMSPPAVRLLGPDFRCCARSRPSIRDRTRVAHHRRDDARSSTSPATVPRDFRRCSGEEPTRTAD